MEYDVVRAESLATLVRVVNERIKEGWEPQGGIFIYEYRCYYQALIKQEKVC